MSFTFNTLLSNGSRLTLSPPISLIRTNEKVSYIAYGVSSGLSVIGKNFGLKITNEVFGFNVPPLFITTNNEYVMAYVDIIADNTKSSPAQYITNIKFVVDGNLNNVDFKFKLYRDGNNISNFSLSDDIYLPGFNITLFSPLSAKTNSIAINKNNFSLSGEAQNTSRFWLTMLINPSDANLSSKYITDILGNGPNEGVVDNKEVLTNISTNQNRVDNDSITVNAVYNNPNNVLQGSFNNQSFKLILTKEDMMLFFIYNLLSSPIKVAQRQII